MQPLQKRTMRKIFVFIVLAVLTSTVVAQTRVIHGKLTCFNRYPVQNVEVASKKAKSRTMTDSLGQFSIVCEEKDVIQIKPKTFQPVKKRVNTDTDSLNINLLFIDTRENRELAVGYGYVSEKDLSYAIDNLQQDNNEFCNYSDIFDLVRGRFSGVTVSGNAFLIRGGNNSFTAGASEALVVVDGVPTMAYDHISPCDIKSINILKGSEAAIYGTRGGNGVVLIETKK